LKLFDATNETTTRRTQDDNRTISRTGVMSTTSSFFFIRILLCCLVLFPIPCMARSYDKKATLTIFDFTSWSYRAEIAGFGNPMNDQMVYHATLMTPPTNYSQLCQVPDSLTEEALRQQQQEEATENNSTENNSTNQPTTNTTTTTSPTPWEFEGPVGLLVSLGGCDVMTKALVALDLHKRVTKDLKYIVFYNNDPNDPDNIATLSLSSSSSKLTSSSNSSHHQHHVRDMDWENGYLENITETLNGQERNDVLGMVFVSVSTGTGTAILGRMYRLAAATGSRPEFQNPNRNDDHEYRQWHLPMVLEKVAESIRPGSGPVFNNDGGGRYPHSYGGEANGSFYWFRFVLFALLIVSPCLRAAYLWWVGGGRIQFRRDVETGRIIGLQYIPPMSNWFGIHHHNIQDGETIHNTLSLEQVMALPEIFYQAPPETEPSKKLASGVNKCSCAVENADKGAMNDHEKNMIDQASDNDDVMSITKHNNSNDKRHDDGDDDARSERTNEVESLDETVANSGSISDNGDVVIIRVSSGEDNIESEDYKGAIETKEDNPLHLSSAEMETVANVDSLEISDCDSCAFGVSPSAKSKSEGVPDEEQPAEGSSSSRQPMGPYTTTTCTTCSICIDEFEVDERLRLLPRCGHAFHTECILPWLTERQGCCPLCKTSVMETDDDEGTEAGDGVEEGNGQRNSDVLNHNNAPL